MDNQRSDLKDADELPDSSCKQSSVQNNFETVETLTTETFDQNLIENHLPPLYPAPCDDVGDLLNELLVKCENNNCIKENFCMNSSEIPTSDNILVKSASSSISALTENHVKEISDDTTKTICIENIFSSEPVSEKPTANSVEIEIAIDQNDGNDQNSPEIPTSDNILVKSASSSISASTENHLKEISHDTTKTICIENIFSSEPVSEKPPANGVEIEIAIDQNDGESTDKTIPISQIKTENLNLCANTSEKTISLVPYRVNDNSSDSDLEEDSESDSSTDSSETSSSSDIFSSSNDDSSEEDCSLTVKNKPQQKQPFKVTKTKGELSLDDLPPIEELCISVPEQEMTLIGSVNAIVNKLVIVRSLRGAAALDLDSILLLQDGSPLGQIFDVLGPVIEPSYAVRFNKEDEIKNKGISVGLSIYYAPHREDLTSFIFVEQLRRLKGSDASWKNNNEPPPQFLDYSDDEEERKAKGRIKTKRSSNEELTNKKENLWNHSRNWNENALPKNDSVRLFAPPPKFQRKKFDNFQNQSHCFSMESRESNEEQQRNFRTSNPFSYRFSSQSSLSPVPRYCAPIRERYQRPPIIQNVPPVPHSCLRGVSYPHAPPLFSVPPPPPPPLPHFPPLLPSPSLSPSHHPNPLPPSSPMFPLGPSFHPFPFRGPSAFPLPPFPRDQRWPSPHFIRPEANNYFPSPNQSEF